MQIKRDTVLPTSHGSRGFNPSKASATEVTVGDESVALKRSGQSTTVIAKILGRKSNEQGETIWLDRLVHEDDEEFVGWQAAGAISTILSCDSIRADPAR